MLNIPGPDDGHPIIATALRLTWLPHISPGQTLAHGITAQKTPPTNAVRRDARRVVDHLPPSFDVAADEAQWLLTLLGADDLRYIFEGRDYDEGGCK